MFGIEFSEIVLFGRVLGGALAGAAALWGLVFSALKHKHRQGNKDRCIVYEWISERLLLPFFVGVLISIVAWLASVLVVPVGAHEGVALVSSLAQQANALAFYSPLFFIWIGVAVIGLFTLGIKPTIFHRHISKFYALNFALAFLLLALSTWTGGFNREQWFFILHSTHSIFTLGTVLILDYLFLVSKSSDILKQHIYPLFPIISKVIWVGLGVDFLGVLLVYSQALETVPKFFFAQTLIGILIINGVLLAGPITRRLIASIKEGGKLKQRWQLIGDVAGTISITSWFAVTLIDAFKNLTIGYGTLMLLYISLIVLLFVGRLIWGHLQKETLPVTAAF